MRVRIGTAGWALPRAHRDRFPDEGSQLVRYAARLSTVEINSSFHRHHGTATYARWAASVPDDFRFSVKVPRTITHERRLMAVDDELDRLAIEIAGLGSKLGRILVQLPPSLAFDSSVAWAFFRDLQDRLMASIVCEPRHASWFSDMADGLLRDLHIARVAADPAPVPEAATPGGWAGTAYFRFHGAPRVYWSSYDMAALEQHAQAVVQVSDLAGEVWVIYDNTASGAATGNALMLRDQLMIAGAL